MKFRRPPSLRPANTLVMFNALAALHKSVRQLQIHNQTGTEMTAPTPDAVPTPDMRSIDQNDINAWATNVTTAAAAIAGVIAAGNLKPADESALNTALGTLDGTAGVTTVTPPADPPADS